MDETLLVEVVLVASGEPSRAAWINPRHITSVTASKSKTSATTALVQLVTGQTLHVDEPCSELLVRLGVECRRVDGQRFPRDSEGDLLRGITNAIAMRFESKVAAISAHPFRKEGTPAVQFVVRLRRGDGHSWEYSWDRDLRPVEEALEAALRHNGIARIPHVCYTSEA